MISQLISSTSSGRITAIVADVRKAVARADNTFTDWILGPQPGDDEEDYERGNVEWLLEVAFLKLMVATEALGLNDLNKLCSADYESAQKKPNGWVKSEMGPDEPYSVWTSRMRQYVSAMETLGNELQQGHSVTKDVVEILRATVYPITDPTLFSDPPANEDDVHRRIEGVLQCVFPDLKRKPALSKPIKNFEPDTGLPSIRTLIEYKYLSKKSDAALIADQILADTRGYTSRDWDKFIYLIYETRRFEPEFRWNALLAASEVSDSTTAIVNIR